MEAEGERILFFFAGFDQTLGPLSRASFDPSIRCRGNQLTASVELFVGKGQALAPLELARALCPKSCPILFIL